MLPIQIEQRITQFYLPATILNYDSIIKFSDFTNLFAPIDLVSEESIKSAIKAIGFDKQNIIDNEYFVKIN